MRTKVFKILLLSFFTVSVYSYGNFNKVVKSASSKASNRVSISGIVMPIQVIASAEITSNFQMTEEMKELMAVEGTTTYPIRFSTNIKNQQIHVQTIVEIIDGEKIISFVAL